MAAMLTFLALTYLLAAMPFGVVITTLYGGDVDLRVAGSGNIGATNVARVFGWRIAVPVLLLDVAKGLVPVLVGAWMFPGAGLAWWAAVGITAFVGHCWPVYLEFRGGKGVATGAGALLGISPVPTLLAALVWLGLLVGTGRSSIAALGATSGMVLIAVWLDPTVAPVVALVAVLVAVRHVTNIRRIVRGEEPPIVRDVRWGRRSAGVASADEVLQQDPGGGGAASPLWRERDAPGDDERG